MPRRSALSVPKVLDQLREWVEDDPRTAAAIAAGLDPPMSRAQLSQIVTGQTAEIQLGTLLRLLRGLDPPRSLRDLDLDP